MKYAASPNFNDRAPDIKLAYIVLHYTGMEDEVSALDRLCDPVSEVSAHYVIGEKGDVKQLVSEARRAWHAGESFWRGITDINSASIGIELVNPGDCAFPKLQITALKKLLKEIIARHKMDPKLCLLAHSDVAPTRKQDPGELFPWQELAEEGLGLWPMPTPQDYVAASEADMKALLGSIGYDMSAPQDSLRAFQRRFHPEDLKNGADQETAARLRMVVRLLQEAN